MQQDALAKPEPITTEIVEEHRQGTPLRPQQPTILRVVRRNGQDNWRTYTNDCY